MSLPSNPQSLSSYDITKPEQAKIFVKRVSDLLLAINTGLLSASGLASILNGKRVTYNQFLASKSVELGSVSTNQSVDCAGATSVAVHLSSAVAVGLTLAHLALGVPVMIWYGNTAGGALNFSIAATQPGGTAYTAVFWNQAPL